MIDNTQNKTASCKLIFDYISTYKGALPSNVRQKKELHFLNDGESLQANEEIFKQMGEQDIQLSDHARDHCEILKSSDVLKKSE